MGTGASAQQASEAVQSASPEELQAYLDSLSPEDRAKLEGAVAVATTEAPAAEAAAEAEAPADAAAAPAEAAGEETKAPAEAAKGEAAEGEAAEGEAAEAKAAEAEGEAAKGEAAEAKAASTSAESLAEYFDKVQSRTAALIGDQEKLMAIAMDPEAKTKMAEESKAWFDAEAKPLLEKSFKFHDTKNTDVLDKEEAAVFFTHLVQEDTDFAQAVSALTIEAGVKMSMGMLGSLSEEEREKIKPQLEEQMKQQIEASQAEVQKKEDAYKANKSDLDAAAFKVLDTNKDGTLQLSEFLAAFEPGSSKNVDLHVALGFVSKEEVEEQKKREEAAKEEAAGCSQQ